MSNDRPTRPTDTPYPGLPTGPAERHHSALVAAIETEIQAYGPLSLLAIVATMLEDRAGPDAASCDQLAERLRKHFDV
jgi:hypothetical protein